MFVDAWRASVARSAPTRSSCSRRAPPLAFLLFVGLLLGRHPRPHFSLEHPQRERTAAEHRIMKRPQVELVAEPGRGVRAQLLELELADLVRERLARPNDVAVHLDLDVVLGPGRVVTEEVDRLLSGPP